jgi:hemimethylated DNA binding protein
VTVSKLDCWQCGKYLLVILNSGYLARNVNISVQIRSHNMPLQREHLQLGALLLCVPLQLLLTDFMGSNEGTRTYAISKLVNQFSEIRDSWLRVEPWQMWCSRILRMNFLDLVTSGMDDGDPMGECPAVEVFRYRDRDGYFGQSPDPRDTRPPNVKYRVGQVIKHFRWGYKGVIIGWDESARAPESWIQQMHGDHKEWRTQPNYAVLVDTRDRPVPQITYIPQENIEVVKHTKVLHPSVEDYFENFDGSQYLPRPWLKAIYRRD